MIGSAMILVGCVLATSNDAGQDAAAEAPASPSEKPTPAASASPAAKTFVLDATKRVYEIGVSWEGAADIRFEVPCAEPSLGDPKRFGIEYAPRIEGQPHHYQHRFVLAPKMNVKDARTYVTFDCAEKVHVVLLTKLVPYDQATFQAEFVTSSDQDARVRAARKDEREKNELACEDRVKDLRAQWSEQSEDALLAGLARRHSARGSVARGRDDFLKVKAVRELVIDKRGYVVFELHNRSGGTVTMKSVEVVDGDGRPLSGVRYHFATAHIEDERRTVGTVGFDLSASKYVRLLVRDEANRAARVDDVRVF